MKVIIKFGETSWRFDDGIGSQTVLEHAIDNIENLLKAIYPEMEGMKLIPVDAEVAAEMFGEDEDSDNSEDANLHVHADNSEPKKRKQDGTDGHTASINN